MQKEQFIYIDTDRNKFYFSDRVMKTLHREDGPAIEYAGGGKEWLLNGKFHREDGPAYELADGYREWWRNGELHREDGPAIEHADGDKEWFLNDERHREDGPAIECLGRRKTWWLNGERLTEEEFNARINPITELTLDEIAAKFGVSVEQLKIKK